ncbi:MAG: hypothetical protein IT486_08330 [Gammaproteobacteria bacterium]|nr:hypothetical protein [Gammaproteobacteria bacterium]
MYLARLLLIPLLVAWSLGATAADLPLDDQDCAKILERWAENPGAVPSHLVERCKEQLAAAPAPVAALAAEPAVADPCTGPGAAGSVLCWGPWATLAPAAAGEPAKLDFPESDFDCEAGSDIADQCVARIVPIGPAPPVEGCAPGTPCGFATLVAGLTSNGDVEATSFERFDLAGDGSAFVVDPGGPDEIESVGMGVIVTPRGDGYENMRSRGRVGDHESRLIARIVRDGESGDIELAADIWTDGNRTNSALDRSGYFAWGIATSQSGLNLLSGNGLSVAFTGPMSVNNATQASLTVNFGSQAGWSGTWTNPAWSFGAGGSVNGVNLLSSPSQFTGNVQSGSVVQGALLGEPGRMGIAHLIDVNLAGVGHIKDVGLLREVTGGPTGGTTGSMGPP